MHKLIAFLLLTATGSLSFVATAEERESYRPLYKVNIANDTDIKGAISTDYMYAYHSKTSEEALKRWVVFSDTYLKDPDIEIDDLTSLTLLRQAAYELARLYYLMGNEKKGDEQLLKAESLVVYTMPNDDQGKTWCRARGFCEHVLPNYLLQPTPKDGAAER